MKKFVLAVVFAYAAFGVGYTAHVLNDYLTAKTEFENAKTALIREARGITREAELRIVSEWRQVARDYLNDYERGNLDGLFAEAVRDESWNSGALAAETAIRVRSAIKRSLCEHSKWIITDADVTARMMEDARIRHLMKLEDAKHAVFTFALKATEANTIDELHRLEELYEKKKVELVRLLQLS